MLFGYTTGRPWLDGAAIAGTWFLLPGIALMVCAEDVISWVRSLWGGR